MIELGMSGFLAQIATNGAGWAVLGATIGCSIIIFGAALGIGMIGSRAVDAMARQPEVAGRIFPAMVVAAALIEGVTFFALLVCFMTVFWEH